MSSVPSPTQSLRNSTPQLSNRLHTTAQSNRSVHNYIKLRHALLSGVIREEAGRVSHLIYSNHLLSNHIHGLQPAGEKNYEY